MNWLDGIEVILILVYVIIKNECKKIMRMEKDSLIKEIREEVIQASMSHPDLLNQALAEVNKYIKIDDLIYFRNSADFWILFKK